MSQRRPRGYARRLKPAKTGGGRWSFISKATAITIASELTRRLPAIGFRPPEASFLAWLDCPTLELAPEPQQFFLKDARVGFSAGADFGAAGKGHVHLNFGCPRTQLDEALNRIERALA